MNERKRINISIDGVVLCVSRNINAHQQHDIIDKIIHIHIHV